MKIIYKIKLKKSEIGKEIDDKDKLRRKNN